MFETLNAQRPTLNVEVINRNEYVCRVFIHHKTRSLGTSPLA
jgi:hypothetical protein